MGKKIQFIKYILFMIFFAAVCMTPYNIYAAETTDIEASPAPTMSPEQYEEVTVTTEQQYMPELGCVVVIKKTVTSFYTLVDGEYVLTNQTLEVTNEFPQATENPGTYDPSQSTAVPVTRLDISQISLKGKRISNNKTRLSWNEVPYCEGYVIYCSEKEKKGYEPIKTIDSAGTTTCTISGLKKKKTYYFKICAFNTANQVTYYSELSDCIQSTSYSTQKIYNKLMKLKKKYPDGYYWNHAGYNVSKNQDVTGFVTDRPCNHRNKPKGIASTCNYYLGRDKVLGYQCWGFASLFSDKIFGKASYSHHKSFKKAKVGDHVRYGHHSVIIVEKHVGYIIVAEANYGHTCMIKWGRKISKRALNGATYYTRY